MIINGRYSASGPLYRQGLQLDTEKQCFRKTKKLFGFINLSEGCKPLPRGDYLLLFRTLYAKCEACTPEDFERSSVMQLALVYRGNRRLVLHESNDTASVLAMAEQLALLLGLRIRDSATDRRHPRWINHSAQMHDKV